MNADNTEDQRDTSSFNENELLQNQILHRISNLDALLNETMNRNQLIESYLQLVNIKKQRLNKQKDDIDSEIARYEKNISDTYKKYFTDNPLLEEDNKEDHSDGLITSVALLRDLIDGKGYNITAKENELKEREMIFTEKMLSLDQDKFEIFNQMLRESETDQNLKKRITEQCNEEYEKIQDIHFTELVNEILSTHVKSNIAASTSKNKKESNSSELIDENGEMYQVIITLNPDADVQKSKKQGGILLENQGQGINKKIRDTSSLNNLQPQQQISKSNSITNLIRQSNSPFTPHILSTLGRNTPDILNNTKSILQRQNSNDGKGKKNNATDITSTKPTPEQPLTDRNQLHKISDSSQITLSPINRINSTKIIKENPKQRIFQVNPSGNKSFTKKNYDIQPQSKASEVQIQGNNPNPNKQFHSKLFSQEKEYPKKQINLKAKVFSGVFNN